MQQYACPNCGASLVFLSSVSVHTTCTHCRSMVVRHDMNLKTMGRVAELLDDMSPFQVGTIGKYKDKSFRLVGRVKVVYTKGTWSEWYVLFDDGREGWLAEAQGNYMMTFPQVDSSFVLPHDLDPMETVKIDGNAFLIEDARRVTYVGTEGELPFRFIPGSKATSIDMRNLKNEFASITINHEIRTVYMGEYVPFETFQFQNLRTLDGW